MTKPYSLRRRRTGGFTLVELAIVLGVVAILAGVAVPAWQDQMRRSRRVDAMDALATLQQAQERWRGGNPSYADDLSALSLPTSSPDGLYTLAITEANASGYELTATAASGTSQAADSGCTTLTLALRNGAIVTGPSACWRQ